MRSKTQSFRFDANSRILSRLIWRCIINCRYKTWIWNRWHRCDSLFRCVYDSFLFLFILNNYFTPTFNSLSFVHHLQFEISFEFLILVRSMIFAATLVDYYWFGETYKIWCAKNAKQIKNHLAKKMNKQKKKKKNKSKFFESIKECEVELTQKGDMVARLQVKASQIGRLLQTLENQSTDEKNSKKTATQLSKQLSKQKSECGPPQKKSHYIDPIPPFNANKIRKSPSASLTSESIASTSSSKMQAANVNTANASANNKAPTTPDAGK